MGSRDHSIKCETCGLQRGGLNDYKCDCDLPSRDLAYSTGLRARTIEDTACGIVIEIRDSGLARITWRDVADDAEIPSQSCWIDANALSLGSWVSMSQDDDFPPIRVVCRVTALVVAISIEDATVDELKRREIAVHRVEFKLSMPGRASWDGRWSGEGKNYAIVRELSDEDLARLFDLAPDSVDPTKCRRIWTHRWSDGWCAQICARVVPLGEDLPKSDGFKGYDWMVDNILAKGDPHGEVTS